MTPAEFDALAAAGYNRIPVSLEVLADTETPISTYRKLAEGPYSYLFESVQGGEEMGPLLHHRPALPHGADGSRLARRRMARRRTCCDRHEVADPLAFIEELRSGATAARRCRHAGIPRRSGRLLRLRYRALRGATKLAAGQPPGPHGHTGYSAHGVRRGGGIRQPRRHACG